jgi:hypothetical protein
VNVTGHKLGKGVGYSDDGLAKIAVLHTGGAPQAARSGHIPSVCRGSRPINWHKRYFTLFGVQHGSSIQAFWLLEASETEKHAAQSFSCKNAFHSHQQCLEHAS